MTTTDWILLAVEGLVVIGFIALGVRAGGVGLGIWGGVGTLVLVFLFGLEPGEPPVSAMLIFITVITATAAMQAAARGEPYAIAFEGRAQYDYAPDVGRAFVTAAGAVDDGAAVYNVPGAVATVEDVVDAILVQAPEAAITWGGDALPFPEELEAVGFERDIGPFPRTPLAVGVAATIEHFRAAA